MNGKDLKRIKDMGDGEWKGYLASEIEHIKKEQIKAEKHLGCVDKKINEINLAIVKLPTHCIQVEVIKEYENRIDVLEDSKIASEAVKKVLIGTGGIGGVGIILAVLKFVFNAF